MKNYHVLAVTLSTFGIRILVDCLPELCKLQPNFMWATISMITTVSAIIFILLKFTFYKFKQYKQKEQKRGIRLRYT